MRYIFKYIYWMIIMQNNFISHIYIIDYKFDPSFLLIFLFQPATSILFLFIFIMNVPSVVMPSWFLILNTPLEILTILLTDRTDFVIIFCRCCTAHPSYQCLTTPKERSSWRKLQNPFQSVQQWLTLVSTVWKNTTWKYENPLKC